MDTFMSVSQKLDYLAIVARETAESAMFSFPKKAGLHFHTAHGYQRDLDRMVAGLSYEDHNRKLYVQLQVWVEIDKQNQQVVLHGRYLAWELVHFTSVKSYYPHIHAFVNEEDTLAFPLTTKVIGEEFHQRLNKTAAKKVAALVETLYKRSLSVTLEQTQNTTASTYIGDARF